MVAKMLQTLAFQCENGRCALQSIKWIVSGRHTHCVRMLTSEEYSNCNESMHVCEKVTAGICSIQLKNICSD